MKNPVQIPSTPNTQGWAYGPDNRDAPFAFADEKTESRFVVSFVWRGNGMGTDTPGSVTDMMERVSADGFLHIPLQDIKGVVVKERSTVQFHNRKFVKR